LERMIGCCLRVVFLPNVLVMDPDTLERFSTQLWGTLVRSREYKLKLKLFLETIYFRKRKSLHSWISF